MSALKESKDRKPKGLIRRVAALEEAVIQLLHLHWGAIEGVEYSYELLERHIARTHAVCECHAAGPGPPYKVGGADGEA